MNYDAFVYGITCSLPERFLMIWEKSCDRMFSGKAGYVTAYKLQSQLYIR